MKDSSDNKNDTPLARFCTFFWGMGLFVVFGLASVIAYAFVSSSDPVYTILSEDRLGVKTEVDQTNAELLIDKDLDGGLKQMAPDEVFEDMKPNLMSAPKASAMPLPTVQVVDPNLIAKGEELFLSKSCATCHGADAISPIAPIYPVLSGKDKTYLVQQMQDIKSGKRVSPLTPTMMPFISQCSDEEIEALGAWLATIK
ncbi:MAG: c-type cytochrome [Akkermansiaceae bacterium]